MTDPITPPPPDEHKADETFSWTPGSPEPHGPAGAVSATATNILESVREVVEDLADRAAPSVRELSARTAELAASAADRAAPLVKRVGEVTADASGRLATKSRAWAADLRATTSSTATEPRPAETGSVSTTEVHPSASEPEPPSQPN